MPYLRDADGSFLYDADGNRILEGIAATERRIEITASTKATTFTATTRITVTAIQAGRALHGYEAS